MGDYRRLRVWQLGYQLVLAVYRATATYPGAERYGLISQSRRAALSVVANLAEGAGRGTDGEFRRFVAIARGSLVELIVELELAKDLAYLSPEQASPLLDTANEVGRMLTGLLKKRRAPS